MGFAYAKFFGRADPVFKDELDVFCTERTVRNQ
jgi:hypothetical protein